MRERIPVENLRQIALKELNSENRGVKKKLLGALAGVGLFALTIPGWEKYFTPLPSEETPQTYPTQTYQTGDMLYLDNGTIKIGLKLSWGGTIVDFIKDGVDFINNDDPGREVQLSIYDGNCQWDFCWNPVQGGNKEGRGSPVINYQLGRDYVYVKSWPLHWDPEAAGRRESDVFYELWYSFVTGYPNALKTRYKITHFGTDSHGETPQEVPATYINNGFDTLVYYQGSKPFSHAPLTFGVLPERFEGTRRSDESWVGLIDRNGFGLILYLPQMADFIGYRPQGIINYLRPVEYFGMRALSTYQGRFYLVAGDYRQVRQSIYALEGFTPPSG